MSRSIRPYGATDAFCWGMKRSFQPEEHGYTSTLIGSNWCFLLCVWFLNRFWGAYYRISHIVTKTAITCECTPGAAWANKKAIANGKGRLRAPHPSPHTICDPWSYVKCTSIYFYLMCAFQSRKLTSSCSIHGPYSCTPTRQRSHVQHPDRGQRNGQH